MVSVDFQARRSDRMAPDSRAPYIPCCDPVRSQRAAARVAAIWERRDDTRAESRENRHRTRLVGSAARRRDERWVQIEDLL